MDRRRVLGSATLSLSLVLALVAGCEQGVGVVSEPPLAGTPSPSAPPSASPSPSESEEPLATVTPTPKPYTVTTFAGGSYGSTDGSGTAARFGYPRGIAIDASGMLYVADSAPARLRIVTPGAEVSTRAGALQEFAGAMGLTVDGSGSVYLADTAGHRIQKVTAAGVVTTVAGDGTAGYADGAGATARFAGPTGVVLDASGSLYVSDHTNHCIRKIDPQGIVSTFAGSGAAGYADSTGASAKFRYPSGIAIDGSGNLYVAERGNHMIRKITPGAVVSTFAGSGTAGLADAKGSNAQFNFPYGMAMDSSGNLYVADRDNHRIRRVSSDGAVATVAGTGTAGSANGSGLTAQFNMPYGVAVDSSGSVFVADYSNHRIRRLIPD